MESQFILRLPEKLLNIDLLEASLVKISNNRVILEYKNVKYPGIITRPATIIESQKILDNKLYKISDISSLVIILDEDATESQILEACEESELSGITPPLKYAKIRRFKKSNERVKMVQEVENKVNQLLEEDDRALRVEVVNPKNKEIDEIAAEIEKDLILENELSEEGTTEEVGNINKEDSLTEEENNEVDEEDLIRQKESETVAEKAKLLEIQIEEKKKILETVTNPILRKRLQYTIKELEEEHNKLLNN